MIRFPIAFIETCVQLQKRLDVGSHQYVFVFICYDNMYIVVCVAFSIMHLLCFDSFLWDAYMSVAPVQCARHVLCQADHHMMTLPRLAHDKNEELYWARVSYMPADGQSYVM